MFGSRSVQGVLGDDFGCKDSFGFEVGDLIALREPASAQCLAFGVFLDDGLTVGFCYLLFDDGLVEVALLLGLLGLIHSNKFNVKCKINKHIREYLKRGVIAGLR